MAPTGSTGRVLELHYVDGDPDGLVTAKTFNWTGQLLVTPRTRLAEGLARKDASYSGVYILTGERDGEPLAYIGESEELAARIRNHDLNKDWWTTAVLVSAAGDQLNKAHVRYLESRLVAEARKIGRIPLANSTVPSLPGLSDADCANMEAFLESLLMVLPAVRIDMFVQRARPAQAPASRAAPNSPAPGERFVLESRKHGLSATALLINGEFVVQAGSKVRSAWEGKNAESGSYGPLYEELRRANVVVAEGDHCVFAQNYAFKSLSAAAAVVMGRTANGLTTWKTTDGRTYKVWEQMRLTEGS
ncbi:GIY-YIG nuclease family protein [soil metagenome]